MYFPLLSDFRMFRFGVTGFLYKHPFVLLTLSSLTPLVTLERQFSAYDARVSLCDSHLMLEVYQQQS